MDRPRVFHKNNPNVVARAYTAIEVYCTRFEVNEFAIYYHDWETENHNAFKARCKSTLQNYSSNP